MRKIILLVTTLLGSAGIALGLTLSAAPGILAAGAHRHHHYTVQPGGPIILTDSPECAASVTTHNGVTGNYCGSQELSALNLELSVTNKGGVYSRLTVKPVGANFQTDFQFYNPASTTNNAKVFEYTPRGIPSGLCVSLSNSGALPVLKTCNSSLKGQQWVASGPDGSGGYQWVSNKSGLAITDPGNAGAYTRVVLATPVDASGQSWSFVQ